MKKLTLFIVVLFSFAASGQTTKPVLPVFAWNQPLRNLPAIAAMGITTVLGPCVENDKALAPDVLAAAQLAWFKGTLDNNLNCVVKNPTGPLPVNCVGIILSYDEPNGKGIPPAVLLGERDKWRALYPKTPIILSLAGDKVTSANFKAKDQIQLYLDYAACADVLSVDTYSMNRNASRYKVTWTADAVRTLKAVTGKPVMAWIECNDQQVLPFPTSKSDGIHTDISRAPTPDEINQEVDAAVEAGACAIGFFFTCDHGAYGWPQSFLPMEDRNHVSMRPQYDAIRSIAISLAGPVLQPQPVTPPEILALQAQMKIVQVNMDKQDAVIAELSKARQDNDARWSKLIEGLRATTQPSN